MKRQTKQLGPLLACVTLGALLSACADLPTNARQPLTAREVSRLFIPATGTYSDIAAGTIFTCALRSDGVVACWGDNSWDQSPATRTAATGMFISVSAYGGHACALRSDGAVECWGNNFDGQAPSVVTPPSGLTFVAVSAGSEHSCAIRSDGDLQCWGDNRLGQAPAARSAASGTYVAVSAASVYTCALTSIGVVECFGELTHYNVPATMTASIGSFVTITASQLRTCGIRTDGAVECGPTQPAPIAGAFTAYDVHLNECGINPSGVAQCQGANFHGQAPATRSAAVGSYRKISAGYLHTCALRTDGAIECWGDMTSGAFTEILPTATFGAPPSVIIGQSIALSLTNAQVPGYPSATSFTYAFDCGDGSGFGAESGTSSVSCSTSTAGTRSVGGRVIDQQGSKGTYTADVIVKTAAEGTSDLRTTISLAPLSPDIRKALMSKLDAALAAIAKGKTASACSALKDFINQVNAQRGKAISVDTADSWLLTAQQLQAALGC